MAADLKLAAQGRANNRSICPVCAVGLSAVISVVQHAAGRRCSDNRNSRLKALNDGGTLASMWIPWIEAFRQFLELVKKDGINGGVHLFQAIILYFVRKFPDQ